MSSQWRKFIFFVVFILTFTTSKNALADCFWEIELEKLGKNEVRKWTLKVGEKKVIESGEGFKCEISIYKATNMEQAWVTCKYNDSGRAFGTVVNVPNLSILPESEKEKRGEVHFYDEAGKHNQILNINGKCW